jgi:hypothetical protein
MQKEPRESRFKRLATKFKRLSPTKLSRAAQSTSTEPTNGDATAYDDHARVQRRYDEAVAKLSDALQYRKDGWESFDLELPDSKKAQNFDDAAFQNKINEVLKAREKSIKDKKGWRKFTYTLESIYTVFSPLAKNFLTNAAQVS